MLNLIRTLIDLYIWAIIIRVVLSWFDVNPYNPFVKFLRDITEPVLSKIRSFIPDIGGLDLSPLVLILALYMVQSLLY